MGTILDDEPHISIDRLRERHGGEHRHDALTFTVTLSAAYDVPVTVDYATADLTPG